MPISPKLSNRPLPSSKLVISSNPIPDQGLDSTEEDDSNSISQGATVGPSSPQRRRPSTGRRRSSSITASAELMSAYSNNQSNPSLNRRASKSSSVSASNGKGKLTNQDEDEERREENQGLLEHYEEYLPSQNFRPRPYHIAIVSCLAALGNGIPLPTVFSLYKTVMCGIVGDKDETSNSLHLLSSEKKGFWSILFPPSPELPLPAECPTSEVASLTSFYSSTLAVTGALLSLLLLQLLTNLTTKNKSSTLGFHFKKLGRKPPLIFVHCFLSLTYLLCAVFPLIFFPSHPILTAVTLGLSRVLADANNGSPLMLLTQNYVFDTTDTEHHASSLAFVDGLSQLGSFPSAAIGGWIASLTRNFWSPFYSAAVVLAIASVYIMTCVPESRKGFREGAGREEEEEEEEAEQRNLEGSSDEERDRESSSSSQAGNPASRSTQTQDTSTQRLKWSPLRVISFLSPLLLFLPVRLPHSTHSSTPGETSNVSKRKRLRYLLLPPLLFLLSLLEACYNVFILPALLLYNTDILGLSVIQNGLVVSGLQAVRGLWLIAIWPRGLSWWRGSSKEEDEQRSSNSNSEDQASKKNQFNRPKRPNPMIRTSYGSTSYSPETPLPDDRAPLGSNSSKDASLKRERSGDLVPLIFSYVQASIGFMILSASRSSFWSNPLIPIVMGTWVLETGSGSHSCRTSLIVKTLGDLITDNRKREQENEVETSDQDQITEVSESNSKGSDPRDTDLETSLLSALQLLATLTLSSIPVFTSAVYSWGLKIDLPESVWVLKALCSLGSLVLAGLVWWVDGW